ncbi:enhancer-of-split related with YRPW motif 1-like [Octopus vulgaris]|uniref:Enhancer-of-split related with YRPW motif 1-like n=1 Tax=Octopus vulgaris TaxID=6645 RepID=A0AA36EZK8_OCTVU|nr:enhancer-of-split related with YRPW motif 1-like [Octopus vulgaris]
MKRSLSESEQDDVFDDRLKSGSPSNNCQVTDRKKRRGIIEKRRRDRINNSLSELRRLVPTAFEKQGSAKLEKAEILQMTVDHLKVLHQKGLNGYNYPDQHALALDYRIVGFRECATEVARYLVTVEGMDIQEPLRLRLLSHLQCYCAQREAAAATKTPHWSSVSTHPTINNQYNGSNHMTSVPNMIGTASTQHTGQNEHHLSTISTSHSGLSVATSAVPPSYSEARVSQQTEISPPSSSTLHSHMRLPTSAPAVASASHQMAASLNTSAQMQQISPSMLPTMSQISQFPVSLNSSMMSPNNHTYGSANGVGINQHGPAVKPYRPWGTELAY